MAKARASFFTLYEVTDSDGNTIGDGPNPDDAIRIARDCVRGTWQDFEKGWIYGVVTHEPGTGEAREKSLFVPLLRFYRGGMPGNKTVIFEAVDFPYIKAEG